MFPSVRLLASSASVLGSAGARNLVFKSINGGVNCRFATAAAKTVTQVTAGAVQDDSDIVPSPLIGEWIEKHTLEAPRRLRDALHSPHQKTKWTYEEFRKHSNAIACGLLELDFKPGDRLIALLEPGLEAASLVIGASRIGVTLVVPQSANDILALIPQVHPRGFFVDPEYRGVDIIKTLSDAIPEMATAQGLQGTPLVPEQYPYLRHIIHTGFDRFSGTNRMRHILWYPPKAMDPLPRRAFSLKPEMPYFIQMTGPSKGLVLSQKQAMDTASALTKKLGITINDRVAMFSADQPLLSVFLGSMIALANASAIVTPGPTTSAATLAEFVAKHHVTAVVGDAAGVDSVPKEVKKVNVSSLPLTPVTVEINSSGFFVAK